MVLVEKIIAIGVVKFQVADVDLESGVSLLLEVVEDVRQRAGDQSSVCIPLCSSSDRECLPRTCLSISEYRAVISLKTAVDHVSRDFIEDSLLLGKHVEYTMELECIVVVLYLCMTQTIALEIEFGLASLRRECFQHYK